MDLSGLLLMGGQNSRMGGTAKAFLTYRGQPFYSRMLESMVGLRQVYLSVALAGLYPDLPQRQIVDRYPAIGPLGGIASALEETAAAALLVLPCDMPRISRELVDYLSAIWQQSGEPFILSEGTRLHPLVGVYTRECQPVVRHMIERGEYRLRTLTERMNFRVVDVKGSDGFSEMLVNVNTPQEYQRLIQ